MKITHIHIERFRGFQNEDFEVGSLLTAIAGQNGTQKSTLLGIITQTFTLKTEDSMRVEKPLCGGSYISAFKDKFRLSPTFDKPKGHEWTISFDAGMDDFTVESIKRTGDPNVRFWKKGARQEGDGYISFPTIFLSLKRLVPVAEEAKIITDDTLLTQEELNDEGGNLAASKIRNLECPSYEICLIDYGCGKFNRKIHIMEQYP